jgi:hypothetical protein
MKRRSLLALAFTSVSTLVAGCSANGSDGDTGTATPTASPTSTPSPTPPPTPQPGRITEVDVTEIPEYGLNRLGFVVTLGDLQSGPDYRVWITIESDAGSKTSVFAVASRYGVQYPTTGGEMTPPEGTTTDGTELTYRVELRTGGEVLDDREDTIEYE